MQHHTSSLVGLPSSLKLAQDLTSDILHKFKHKGQLDACFDIMFNLFIHILNHFPREQAKPIRVNLFERQLVVAMIQLQEWRSTN